MINRICTFFVLVSFSTLAQQLPLVTNLDNSIAESSGLVYINGALITHNDSGGANELYEINTLDGTISRTVSITNATNVDWEDLTADDTYIYIADFGNNSGNRTDLKIYRILISDFFDSESVSADIIEFSYKDQVDFSSNPGATDYDAEALISFNGDLFIFTKQWVSQNTSIYKLSSSPGNYELEIEDTITIGGLVTGAAVSTNNSTILLTGYNITIIPFGFQPFIVELSGFSNGLFSNGSQLNTGVSISGGTSDQIEAITPYSSSDFYISSELFGSDNPGLFSYTSSALSLNKPMFEQIDMYPNPSSEIVYFKGDITGIEVYNLSGQLLLKQPNKNPLDLARFSKGIYHIILLNSDNGIRMAKKLIVN